MLSRLRDLARTLRVPDAADFISFTIRKFFKLVEMLALPVLLLGTLTLVAIAASRALAWSSMTPLIVNPKDRVQAETQIFVTLGQILGGGFILTGLYFTGKSYILARRGQFGERLGAAIEGLGDPNLQRRVSSIISLGAMIGDERQNVSVVTDVLCTFIRTTTTTEAYSAEYSNAEPRADIQTAISVLARVRRRTAWLDWVKIDLRKSVLPKANFNEGDFRTALFEGCILTDSSFFRARLARANFSEATLGGSNFNQTDLRRASFYRSTSPKCWFRRSNMVGTNLTLTDLTECSFDGARIINCTFGQARLGGATFDGIRIRGGEYFGVDPEVKEKMGVA
jgi:uncharacterized protein YjbI with pentapeptide repeats